MTRWHDLTDGQWAALLSAPSGRGRPPKWSRRQLIDGIRWRIRTGAPWRDVPESYAPWSTVYGRFRRWQRDGTWAKILAALQAHAGRRREDQLDGECGLHDQPDPPEHSLLGVAGREPWSTAQGSGRSPERGGPGGRAARAPWPTAPRGRGVATGEATCSPGEKGIARTCGPGQPERAPSQNRKEDRPPATEAA
ncbi:transposase [Nonomuraea dietziae]|uniref:transposase n=1 Tax=Nonomuraea dietziae TaxID=65515 RepID=UPI003F4D6CC6